MGETLTARWASVSDGPWIHVDDICSWLRDQKASAGKEPGGKFLIEVDDLCGVLEKWAGQHRRDRLKVVERKGVAAFEDLITLRDELAEDP